MSMPLNDQLAGAAMQIVASTSRTLAVIGTDEDWCRVSVDVLDSGFSANFTAFLQVQDVEYFADNLSVMYKEVGSPKEAVLQCHEPGIFIKLTSDKHGHILGEYEFKNETQGFNPVLSGILNMDQSYLPGWENACRTFLAMVK